MSLNNPFAKPVPKKANTNIKQIQKTDSTRENVKKQLMNALDKSKDNSLPGLKLTSEEIAKEIEEEIYKQSDNSSKSREYRDKIRKLDMRLKGPRNNFIREIIKTGKLSIIEFCNLSEKDLMDDNYFKKLEGVSSDEVNDKKENDDNNINKPNNFKHQKKPIMKPPSIRNFLAHKPVPPAIHPEIQNKKEEDSQNLVDNNEQKNPDIKNDNNNININKTKNISKAPQIRQVQKNISNIHNKPPKMEDKNNNLNLSNEPHIPQIEQSNNKVINDPNDNQITQVSDLNNQQEENPILNTEETIESPIIQINQEQPQNDNILTTIEEKKETNEYHINKEEENKQNIELLNNNIQNDINEEDNKEVNKSLELLQESIKNMKTKVGKKEKKKEER